MGSGGGEGSGNGNGHGAGNGNGKPKRRVHPNVLATLEKGRVSAPQFTSQNNPRGRPKGYVPPSCVLARLFSDPKFRAEWEARIRRVVTEGGDNDFVRLAREVRQCLEGDKIAVESREVHEWELVEAEVSDPIPPAFGADRIPPGNGD